MTNLYSVGQPRQIDVDRYQTGCIMWFLLLTGVGALILTYIIYIIVSSPGTDAVDQADHSFDAFIEESTTDEETEVPESTTETRYVRRYDKCGRQLLILYGTEYGFSEEVARKLFDRIEAAVSKDDPYPWQPRIVNMKYHEQIDLDQEHLVFLCMSTAGDGVPPREARPFYNTLVNSSLNFSYIQYSVLAIGDSNYPHFCRAGKMLDERLCELGAHRIIPRHDVDLEDDSVVQAWFGKVIKSLDEIHVEPSMDYLQIQTEADQDGYSRNKPIMAKLKVKKNLSVFETAEDKETIHCEFDIGDSGITWISGDALGLYPNNSTVNVELFLESLGCSGTELVDVPKWAYHPKPEGQIQLQYALTKYYDLKNVKPELLLLLQENANGTSHEQELNTLLVDGLAKINVLLHEYLYDREVADVLNDFHEVARKIKKQEILSHIRALQPRFYSISSAPQPNVQEICITVAVLRYISLGKSRTGVTTTFLQDHLIIDQSCPVFISMNPDFRLPGNTNIPIIMIGPGTGIAPYIAFLQERIHTHSKGRNLVYFGCRHRDRDYLYREELETWAASCQVELRLAFSRDQPHKTYVQDMLQEDSTTVWKLLHEEAAHLYICGDAKHMAQDVHKVLTYIAVSDGGLSESEAGTFYAKLESEGRYQKDVWVT